VNAKGTSLRAYALTRLALAIPMVFILLTMVFLLMRVAPGDPINAALGGHAPPAAVNQIKRELGYDKPIYVQYLEYLKDIAEGNLGTTITDHRLFGIVIYATPVFFLGLMAQLFFGSYLGWLPVSDRASPITQATLVTHTNIYTIDAIIDRNWSALGDVLMHLILPAVTLGLVTAGVFIRLIRVNVIRTMKDDYIEAARARGISERSVVYDHAFRNALVPVITIVGLTMALLLGGAVLTETTFNWPGIGHELVDYLGNRDYAAVQGIIIVFALVVVVVSLVIDFVNAFIDPRIRY